MKNNYIAFIFSIFCLNSSWANSHHPEEFLKSVAGTKDEGMKIVQHYCAVCHADKPLLQIGAPKIGNSIDWRPRLKQGMSKLFEHTNLGINAMPSRGGCFECSDEQLLLAISAMLPRENTTKK